MEEENKSPFYCDGRTNGIVECPIWWKCKHHAVEPEGSEERAVIFTPSDAYNGGWDEDDFPCQMFELDPNYREEDGE